MHVLVAGIWLGPGRRIECVLHPRSDS